jgi:hypothetical protein
MPEPYRPDFRSRFVFAYPKSSSVLLDLDDKRCLLCDFSFRRSLVRGYRDAAQADSW